MAFRGNQDRGLLLTSMLVAGWVSWHLGYQALALVACAAPATVFRALSFLLSWFDKPVTATPAGRARLDRLRVTVAVPVYNEDPGLLDRCIFAIMNQSRPVELIWVVDDGSATDYAALERHWAGKWANGTEVRWSRQPNLGKRQDDAAAEESLVAVDGQVLADRDPPVCRFGADVLLPDRHLVRSRDEWLVVPVG